MAWIVGIGVFLFLLFAFPKQVGGLLLLCALIGAGIFGFYWFEDKEQERILGQIEVVSRYDVDRCDPSHPILVVMKNNSPRVVQKVTFTLRGYNPGYSDPVVTDSYLSSDKILAPGAAYGSCWRAYKPSYAQPYQESLLRWDVDKLRVTTAYR